MNSIFTLPESGVAGENSTLVLTAKDMFDNIVPQILIEGVNDRSTDFTFTFNPPLNTYTSVENDSIVIQYPNIICLK